MDFYKYQGAGNDFLIADNRDGKISLTPERIQAMCDRRYGIGADGVMLLENADGYDFKMVYYNSDGSGGMMCGNGGRCIVAFADFLGLKFGRFIAADGEHEASILSREGNTSIVKLKMRDVDELVEHPDGCFLDTGTRHFVKVVDDIDGMDVRSEGPALRYDSRFAPIGVNVNFIEAKDSASGAILHVRTYEKGIEDETYACGTGITASAIEAYKKGLAGVVNDGIVHVPVRALRDELAVEFEDNPHGAMNVYLIGPATIVAKVILNKFQNKDVYER